MRKDFRESILQEKAKKRNERITAAVMLSLGLLAVTTVGTAIWSEWRDTRPTWADFQAASPASSDNWYVQAANPKTGVPNSVTINGEEWSIVLAQKFDEQHVTADTDCHHRTIAYLYAEDPRQLRTNVLHEIFHAGACLHGGDTWWNSEHPTAEVHPGIYHLGQFWSEFSLANPAFMEWLATQPEVKYGR